MAFTKTMAWLNRKDNRPPPGVGKMKVRKTATKHLREGFKVTMETSCGNEKTHIAGRVKLTLHTAFGKPIVKRFQVDDHREAMDEFNKLIAMVTERA